MKFDDPEDPRLKRVHQARLIKRDIDQLLGICEFAIQDGNIDQQEAEAILRWLDNHSQCIDTWPASVLYDRLIEALEDGHLDAREQEELLDLVQQIATLRREDEPAIATSLPLDTPPPEIIFDDRYFCFTGVFDFGSRAECENAVTKRGGYTLKDVTKKLHYLVIGNIGSEVWKHSTFGNKIAKAVEYRDKGREIIIVSEAHWIKFVK